MRKEFAALKREFAELQAQARAQLCTCGKTSKIPIFNYAFPKTCAEEREVEARRNLPPERCPAMHPDGDALPQGLTISLSFCQDAKCECHKAPDHTPCPTCDPDYFKHCVTQRRTEVDPPLPSLPPPSQLVPATWETPARDVVAVMRPEYRPRPQLPPPSTSPDLYGRDPASLPDCRCGHLAALHREVSMAEAGCAHCGLPDGDHAHSDVLVLSGFRPCVYKHPSPGCAVLIAGRGPCICLSYASREAAA